MKWSKDPNDRWTCKVPPDGRFTLKAAATGDGRWTWEVYDGPATGPMASGKTNSLAACKHLTEGFLKRAGHI